MLRRVFLKSLAGTSLMLPGLAAFGDGVQIKKPVKPKPVTTRMKSVGLSEAQYKRLWTLLTSKERDSISPDEAERLLREVGYDVKRSNAVTVPPNFLRALNTAPTRRIQANQRLLPALLLLGLLIGAALIGPCVHVNKGKGDRGPDLSDRALGKRKVYKTQYGFYVIE